MDHQTDISRNYSSYLLPKNSDTYTQQYIKDHNTRKAIEYRDWQLYDKNNKTPP